MDRNADPRGAGDPRRLDERLVFELQRLPRTNLAYQGHHTTAVAIIALAGGTELSLRAPWRAQGGKCKKHIGDAH